MRNTFQELNTIQYSTIKYNSNNPTQYNALQCNKLQYNTIEYNTIENNSPERRYNAIRHNTMHNTTRTIQYNIIQHNTMQGSAYQRQGLPIYYLQRTIPRQRRAPKNLPELLCPVQYIHQRYVQNMNKTNRVSSSEFFQPIEF